MIGLNLSILTYDWPKSNDTYLWLAVQVVQARMIGTNEQGVPMVHLYRAVAGQTTMVNR